MVEGKHGRRPNRGVGVKRPPRGGGSGADRAGARSKGKHGSLVARFKLTSRGNDPICFQVVWYSA